MFVRLGDVCLFVWGIFVGMFEILGIKPKALYMKGKGSSNESLSPHGP